MARVVRTALATAFGSVDYDAQLSVVDHLEEFRTRLIVSLAVIAVAFGLCFWQNHQLISIINAPLTAQTQQQARSGQGEVGAQYRIRQGAEGVATQVSTLTQALRGLGNKKLDSSLSRIDAHLRNDRRLMSSQVIGDKPVTLGIGEPLTTTASVSLIFALILSLPVILFQIYGFFMPGLEPAQRRRLKPMLAIAPGLFIAGVVFGYFVVLPAAVHFLQSFNSNQFDVLVQASQYYHFAGMTMLAMGLVFEVPLAVVGLTQSGILSTAQMRRGRKLALAGSAAVAAFLPGDAITMLLEAAPLYVLYEVGILISALLDRRRSARERAMQ